MKKVLAILLAAIMLLSVMSFASADEPALSGTLKLNSVRLSFRRSSKRILN